MKKFYLSVLVAGSLVTSLATMEAFAQSSATFYGKIDIGLFDGQTSVTDNSSASLTVNEKALYSLSLNPKADDFKNRSSSMTTLSSGETFGSRWGMRVNEDLGNGYSAGVQLEAGFSADTGDTDETVKQFNRQSTLSLSGGFGTLSFGRQWAISDDVSYDIDQIGYWGANRTLDVRVDNSIKYSSSFGPVGVALMYGLSEDGVSSSNGVYSGMGLFLEQGVFRSALSFEQRNAVKDRLGLETSAKVTTTAFAIGYNFGVVDLFADYAINRSLDTNDSATDTASRLSSGVIGAVIPLNDTGTTFGLSVKKDKLSGYVLSESDREFNSTAFALKLSQPLSSRTQLYTSFYDEKTTGTNTVDSVLATREARSNKFGIGLVHNF